MGMRPKGARAGGVMLGPPRSVAGVTLRAVCRTRVQADALPGGVWTEGEAVPVAVLIRSGDGDLLVDLDGRARDPADFGLRIGG